MSQLDQNLKILSHILQKLWTKKIFLLILIWMKKINRVNKMSN